MKKISLLIFLIFSISILSQNEIKTNKNITDNINSLETQYEKRIKDLDKYYKLKSDSLNKELLYFKVKEDFYSAALADQGNRFTLILSGILGLFALISFGVFKYEVSQISKKTKKKLNAQKKEFNKYKNELLETNTDLNSTKGNLFTSIAIYFQKEEEFVNAFHYFIVAAKSHGNITDKKKLETKLETSEEHNYDVCLSNLNLALENLKKIKLDEDKQELQKKIDKIKKVINIIYNFNNEEVKEVITQIRTNLPS